MTMQCAPSGADAWRLTPRLLTPLQGNRGTGPAGRFQIFHRLLALNHGHAMRAFRRCCVAAHVPPSAWLPETSVLGCLTSVRGCLTSVLGALTSVLGALTSVRGCLGPRCLVA
jgi:hypothetical protein